LFISYEEVGFGARVNRGRIIGIDAAMMTSVFSTLRGVSPLRKKRERDICNREGETYLIQVKKGTVLTAEC